MPLTGRNSSRRREGQNRPGRGFLQDTRILLNSGILEDLGRSGAGTLPHLLNYIINPKSKQPPLNIPERRQPEQVGSGFSIKKLLAATGYSVRNKWPRQAREPESPALKPPKIQYPSVNVVLGFLRNARLRHVSLGFVFLLYPMQHSAVLRRWSVEPPRRCFAPPYPGRCGFRVQDFRCSHKADLITKLGS